MDFTEDPLLRRALDFAELSLAGQKRKSGEYIVDHCKRVAQALYRYKVTDSATLAAALLHHSLSEGAASKQDITDEFGSDISSMVDAFEKLRIIRLGAGMQEEFIENLRKMFLVLAKDLRVVLVKLSDITDNLTTIDYLPKEKGVQLARETLEIFAPLAERLGMSEMRGQMQDLAFKYLEPEEYAWVIKFSGANLEKLGRDLLKVKAKLISKLEKDGIKAVILSRVKHPYSLYTKLQRPEVGKDINKIYDLMALRIIVDSKEDCYQALSVVNTLFHPIQDKVSDYIVHPKPNGYQSIHARFYGPSNIIFEVQIRTKKMHEEAEYGIAAHWYYTDIKSKGVSENKLNNISALSSEKLEWVKKLSDWQEEIQDNQEFLQTVKTNLFGERIYVFTPKGDVKDLPVGATPIDFAYKVHTDLGEKAIGAKVNGKMVSLNHKLKNADVVEIIKSKDATKKPNRDWADFVATKYVRKKIKKAYT